MAPGRTSQRTNILKKSRSGGPTGVHKVHVPAVISSAPQPSKIIDDAKKLLGNHIKNADVRFIIEPMKMRDICEKLVSSCNGEGDILEQDMVSFFNCPEAAAALSPLGVPPMLLKQEIIKYLLVCSSEIDSFSAGSLLMLITELSKRDRLVSLLPGYPRMPPPNVETFANISREEFNSLGREERNDLCENWIKKVQGFTSELDNFLKARRDLSTEYVEQVVQQKEKYLKHIDDVQHKMAQKVDDEASLFHRFRECALREDGRGLSQEEREATIKNMFNSIDASTLRVLLRLFP